MEVLLKFGTDEMQREWLIPLMEGQIRSAFLMTDPQTAPSDATNISMPCVRDGDHYVLNGEKWWATGAGAPRCQVYIVMVYTPKDGARHDQHSMLVISAKTDGIEILRPMEIYGSDDAPHGHMHIRFRDVRVSKYCMWLVKAMDFVLPKAVWGPDAFTIICGPLVWLKRHLNFTCERSLSRKALGQPLARLGANYDIIAQSRIEIEATQLLCLKTARLMEPRGSPGCGPLDQHGQDPSSQDRPEH